MRVYNIVQYQANFPQRYNVACSIAVCVHEYQNKRTDGFAVAVPYRFAEYSSRVESTTLFALAHHQFTASVPTVHLHSAD